MANLLANGKVDDGDANNNNNGSHDSGYVDDSKRGESNQKAGDTMNESGSEDWQILEADETLGQETIQQNSNSTQARRTNLRRQSAVQQQETVSDTSTAKRQQYVEINPLEARKQSRSLVHLCTAIYSLMPLTSALVTLTLCCLIFTKYYLIPTLYFVYVFLTRNLCNKGGSRIEYIYNNKFWSYLAAYFPIKLRFTEKFQLEANQNYILNYHPHGISAFGAVTVFATNGLNLSQVFPGIKSRFMVHETSFVMPIMKETFSFRGDCSVNSKSIDYMLSQESKGNLLCIVGGGLAEADLSDEQVLKIVVAQRKGFVKKALTHGANLIPCIAFGENSVFHKVNFAPKSFLHRLESRWYSLFKFKHPIYYGRSIISDKLRGVMPLKRPITVVLGDPMIVERDPSPSQMAIDELHSRYLKQLESMYEANADLCTQFDRKMELV